MQFFNKDDVLNAFHYRVSTRSYDGDKKIPAEDFNYILELGRLSPSSVGSEPWQFLVLQNADLRQKLKPYCWGHSDHGNIEPHCCHTCQEKCPL